MSQDKEYIRLKLIGCIDDKKKLAEEYKVEEIKGTIGAFVQKKLGLSPEEYVKLQEKYDQTILLVKKYYSSEERKDGFGDIHNFYSWYTDIPKKCCYCGIESDDLEKYFNDKNIQYRNARQRGRILEIERVVTANKKHNIYSAENCKLACYICNNSKSDFISAKNFKPIARGINEFWNKIEGINIKFNEKDEIWELDTQE